MKIASYSYFDGKMSYKDEYIIDPPYSDYMRWLFYKYNTKNNSRDNRTICHRQLNCTPFVFFHNLLETRAHDTYKTFIKRGEHDLRYMPSIDRINSKVSYINGNIRVITMSENSIREKNFARTIVVRFSLHSIDKDKRLYFIKLPPHLYYQLSVDNPIQRSKYYTHILLFKLGKKSTKGCDYYRNLVKLIKNETFKTSKQAH